MSEFELRSLEVGVEDLAFVNLKFSFEFGYVFEFQLKFKLEIIY